MFKHDQDGRLRWTLDEGSSPNAKAYLKALKGGFKFAVKQAETNTLNFFKTGAEAAEFAASLRASGVKRVMEVDLESFRDDFEAQSNQDAHTDKLKGRINASNKYLGR